ncbi:MAG: flagellar biosynthetic protein FliO [Acidobacteria bacterium]|nr:flagellar biosynthetic protein FliO [Acidobacteriota bacterium]
MRAALLGLFLSGAFSFGYGQATDPPADPTVQEEQTLPEYEPPTAPVQAPSGFKVIGSLFVVLGLIVLFGYLARKFLPQTLITQKNAGHMRILQNLPLGGGKFVSLIEAEGQKLLIGVSEKHLNLIARLDPFAMPDDEKPSFKTVEQMLEDES